MRDMIRELVKTTINSSLSDIPVSITLRSTKTSAYNPLTGQASRDVDELVLKAVLANINSKDTNDLELLTSGKKALIAGKDLGDVKVDALDDTVLVDGIPYQLKSYKVDAVGALYSLMLIARSPK